MRKKVIKVACCITVALTIFTGCGQTNTENEIESTEKQMEGITEEKVTEQIEEEKQLIAFTDKVIPEEANIEGPYFIRINRTANIVEIFSLNGEKELVKTMLCSVGLPGTGEFGNETPLGSYEIYERYRWRSLFGNVQGQYAIRFNGHILFHSVPYKSNDASTLKTDEYNKLGEPASLGCVRLSVADAKWIYDNCPNGTMVEVIEGNEAEPFRKPLGIKVAVDSEYAGWDPTDPDVRNPWIGKLPVINNVKDITIVKGSNKELIFTVLNEVYGTDYDGTRLEVFIENIDSINLNEYGTYEIIYGTTGVYGATVYDDAMVNVVDEIKVE